MCGEPLSRSCLLVGDVKDDPGTERGRECDAKCPRDDSFQ